MQTTPARPPIKVLGLTFAANSSALISFVLLWVALAAVALLALNFSLSKALILGFAGALLHWLGETLHQFGHAWAARSTGNPMTGVRYWGLLSSSIYPPDEPVLPGAVHIRRALGGPLFSFAVGGISLLILLVLVPGSWSWWLMLFFVLDNLLVFSVGALLPLGFTDGTTLLSLARNRN